MAIRAIVFDLGNTLVGYYTSSEFPLVLRRCLRECARALGHTEDPARDEDLFERALLAIGARARSFAGGTPVDTRVVISASCTPTTQRVSESTKPGQLQKGQRPVRSRNVVTTAA